MQKICKIALLLLVSATAFPCLADIGPKPTVTFSFPQNTPIRMTQGTLLLCQQSSCSDAKPLEPAGPQNFSCDGTMCHGLAYGFAPYMQLRITRSDGVEFTSPIFKKKAFDARYTLGLKGKTLEVTEQ